MADLGPLEALVALLADAVADRLRATAGGAYTKRNPPPELCSPDASAEEKRKAWRRALDLHRDGKVTGSKMGREIVITREAWAACLASSPLAPPKPRRTKSADRLDRFPRNDRAMANYRDAAGTRR